VKFGSASADLNYTWRIPSMTFSVATYAKGTPGHSWQAVCSTRTDPTLKAGLQVSKYIAAAGLEVLTNAKLVKDAQDEFNGYITKFGYNEPVPKDVKVPSFQDLYGIEPGAVPGVKK
jgi:aminobenzoyl-glutamate utilization protein B